jgi:hypothetical protein
VECDSPDYWAHINFQALPGNYQGFLKLRIQGSDDLLTLDAVERLEPEVYEDFIKEFLYMAEEK